MYAFPFMYNMCNRHDSAGPGSGSWGSLSQVYVHEKRMYTAEECEDYFRKEMLLPSDDHAAFQLPRLPPVQPGENKYG